MDMGTSVFIAKIFGLCYLVIGTGFLINRKAFQRIMDDFGKNAALVYLSGVFALVVGLVIIFVHNDWVANWTVIITLIGWAGFLKGVWLITFPESALKLMQVYQENERLLTVHATVALLFGVVLTFLGFFAG